MTRRHRYARPLCPHGCIDGYMPDPDTGERMPCPHCQAGRLAAVAAARAALGPEAHRRAREQFGNPLGVTDPEPEVIDNRPPSRRDP